MVTNDYLDPLIDGDVLATADGSLALTEAYTSSVAERSRRLEAADTDQLVAHLDEAADSLPAGQTLTAVATENPRFVAELLTVAEFTDLDSADAICRAAIALHELEAENPNRKGVPTGFLPVALSDLSNYLAVMSASIVYVWREDCEPCKAVKAEYEAIQAEIPASIAQFAVYGPAAASRLHDEYSVEGAPVSLFMVNDRVDVRHTGTHGRDAILGEVETLLSQSVTSADPC